MSTAGPLAVIRMACDTGANESLHFLGTLTIPLAHRVGIERIRHCRRVYRRMDAEQYRIDR